MKKVFVIDNYDSFTYNLVHYLEELDCEVTVKRNDQFDLDELEDYPFLLLSPGPGIPEESGLLKAAIERYAPQNFEVGRYHSWVVKTPLPEILEATSIDEQGQLMSLRHKIYDVRAVQYHPESVLTPHGKKIMKNWINSTI